MQFVHPIKKKSQIAEIKNLMAQDGKYRDLFLFTLGINSGLRIGDILRLKYSDVLQDNQIKEQMVLKERKTGKEKRFPLNKSIRDALEQHLKHLEQRPDKNGYVFAGKRSSKPISRVYVWKILHDIAVKAGIKESIACHSLRKTFGTQLRLKAVGIEVISNLLNHSNSSVTKRYLGIDKLELDKVYTDLNL